MKKTIMFTDIHMGNKGNSAQFNDDCLNFIDFVIETAKEENITRCFFLGDYFHSRNTLNVSTLKAGISGIRKLSEYFDDVYMIPGNHDSYYRDSIEVHSLEFVKEFKNVHLIEKITTIEDFTFVPWLVGDEWKKLKDIKSPYILGHFEFPGFLLNAMVRMPDLGKISIDDFDESTKYIFSGHFHKRQIQRTKKNYEIHYIGNSFPHNFADANDSQRGVCIIEDDTEPRYINWEDMPNYLVIPLSELLENPELMTDKTYAKVKLDLNLNAEDAMFVRETFMKIFSARDISYVHDKSHSEDYTDLSEIHFDTIDSIVIKSLENVESSLIDKRKLIELYNSL
jgi:DNA repair exonuclease SbcCD nuclease subunit